MYSYVSILSTDNYLLGILVLNFSLQKTKPKHPFHVLVTPNLEQTTLNTLELAGIKTIPIEPIPNPHNPDKKDRRYYNYSKLNMWNTTQFQKIVYLDADMVVMHNIDELFDKYNMSSTNSGGGIISSWKQLNSGLIVLEPSQSVFEDMKSKVGKIEKEKGKGDQAFLHCYYSDWPEMKELHLSHIYNVFHNQLDGYHKKHGYYLDEHIRTGNKNFDEKRVKIVHYIGQNKPWMKIDEIKKMEPKTLEEQANKIWLKYFREFKKDLKSTGKLENLEKN